ncbi:MAG: echA1 [Parcubacteria group bacterium]|nr:echA1 [Parcubacteria group bacterium]
MESNPFIQAFGWYGLLAILGAYALVSFGILSSASAWYQVLNLTGALGIVAVAFAKRDFQPFWLNVIWSVVALAALVRIFFFS